MKFYTPKFQNLTMKVGLIAESFGMESLKHVFQGLEQSLSQHHEVVYCPLEYYYTSPRRQSDLREEFLNNCDVVVGRIDEEILKSREHLGGRPPLVGFLMGTMSRGAAELATLKSHLRTTDVLVGNCTSDLEITRKFFANAQTRKLPFAVDGSVFYPADDVQRQKIKTDLGFHAADRILLYAGRVTVEKNLHTLLRIYSILQDLVPNLHLVIAGEIDNVPFGAMGVYSISMTTTLMRLIKELDLNAASIHFVGRKSQAQLRDIYAASDVLVNMTLHHDENFGYSQVEAMASGTPVVGTSWGGLKDTILHGETGYHVSTVVTGAGVKVNWWEGVNRLVSLLEDDDTLRRFRERSRIHAVDSFSHERYSEILETILNDCTKNSCDKSEPLITTDFAEQFWLQCMPRSTAPPSFQRGAESFELYKELIQPFTGVTEATVPFDATLSAEQLLAIAVPVRVHGLKVKPDDPIFPVEIAIPEDMRRTCEAILEVMQKEPVIAFERLEKQIPEPARHCLQTTLRWMFDQGLVLRTNPIDGSIDPENAGEQMSKPLFSIKSVDFSSTDVIVIK
ncbi:MAG TPA: glycosyltransferase family 4 protein [Pyrinomonadaceae bacterium]|nr:glycosyltransferase family 4 protein [Pyrinomonadaceae bacterium]